MKNTTILRKIFISCIITIGFLNTSSFAKTLKWAHVYEAGTPYHKAALIAANKFKELTNGRYEIKVFPSSSLGKEIAINEGLSLGTIDIIYTGSGIVGNTYAPISISGYPFMFRSFKHWKQYSKSSLLKELEKEYTKASGGNKIMGFSYYGQRHVTSNKPILKPSDMKNLKIRVPNAAAYLLFPKSVGANPTPMAFSEVYLALQQGVVDAQENPLPTIKFKKFYEVQSNINLTAHITDSLLIIVSASTLSKMSEKDQELLSKAIKMGSETSTEEVRKEELNLASWFRSNNIQVNEVDRKPFIDKISVIYKNGNNLPFSAKQYNILQKIGM